MTRIDQKRLERVVFERFLAAFPKFRAELNSYEQPEDDPPDVLCRMSGGMRVGFELKQWLDEAQMREAKGIERIQESILQAMGELPPNQFRNIAFLWVHAKNKIRIKDTDTDAFRSELLRLVEETDAQWSKLEPWHSPQGFTQNDFSHYPGLAKYLSAVKFFPREFRDARESRWITFPNRSNFYSHHTAVNALRETLASAIDQYRGMKLGYDFNLLLHYSYAHLYNSPVQTLSYDIKDAVREASIFIEDDCGIFNKIFLLITDEPDQVYQLN